MKITRQSLKRAGLYDDEVMYVSEWNDRLWATNSYYLVEFERVAEVWLEFNLEPKPGTYSFKGNGIALGERTPPNLEYILSEYREYDESHEMVFKKWAGHRVLAQRQPHDLYALHNAIDTDPTNSGMWIAIDMVYTDIVCGHWDDPVIAQLNPNKPVAFYHSGDPRELMGLVMPVRMT